MASTSRRFRRLWVVGCLAACGGEAPPVDSSAPVGGGGSGASSPNAGSGASSGLAGHTGSASGGATPGVGGEGGLGGSSTVGGAGFTTAGGGREITGGAGMSGAAGAAGSAPSLPRRVLLYHFSALAIATVPNQLKFLTARLNDWGFEVEQSDDPAVIDAAKLATLSGVAMINTRFEPFGKSSTGTSPSTALAAFVEAGGGLFGTHCAAVTFQNESPPNAYNQLLGGRGGDGYFDGTSSCRTVEAHPTTSLLPTTFEYQGNLDNADFLAADTKVLVRCQWSGGAQKDVPISWYRTAGRGRVFYTNFAKEAVDLEDPLLGEKHILAGLAWVLGR